MPPRFATLVEMFEGAVRQHGPRPAIGTHEPDGTWHWTTYDELGRSVERMRAGLAGLGIRAGDRVAIVSNNRLEWVVTAQATYGLSATLVPMYEAQRDDDWRFILTDSRAEVCFVATESIRERVARFLPEVPSLRHIVCFEGRGVDTYAGLLKGGTGEPQPRACGTPDASTIALLIYTSGTTGNPKGVELTHGGVSANVSAMLDLEMLQDGERTLAFLPWAHVFGGCVELNVLLASGGSIAICDDAQRLLEYLPQVRPTMLVGVPRIWNRIHDAIRKEMASRPAPIRALFEAGLRAGAASAVGEVPSRAAEAVHMLADRVVLSRIRGRFGGRLRFVLSGAATLSPEVARLIEGLGIRVHEGYGMTECSGTATANRPGMSRLGTVGKAIPGVRVELDRCVAAAGEGEGEVIIHGTGVMAGYHGLPDATREVLTADGGLRSGDLGRIDGDGFLTITGRVKELYKLSNGKYVAPAPLEEALQQSPYVAQIVIHGENLAHNVAMVVPDLPALECWSRENGVSGDPLASRRVHRLVLSELEKRGRDFKSYERIADFFFEREPLTLENGLLTPTFKVKRRAVLERFRDRFEAISSV